VSDPKRLNPAVGRVAKACERIDAADESNEEPTDDDAKFAGCH
jgi:hypothetical protein